MPQPDQYSPLILRVGVQSKSMGFLSKRMRENMYCSIGEGGNGVGVATLRFYERGGYILYVYNTKLAMSNILPNEMDAKPDEEILE